jgi:hypothetical protein
MGYNIEVSFNILKHSSVTEIQELIKEQAHNCGCNFCYEDYEFETNVQYKRNHCIMLTNFEIENTAYFITFLRKIKRIPGIYIECIYDDENNNILYASRYFLTQKITEKKSYKTEKRKRCYSEEEILILNEVERKK